MGKWVRVDRRYNNPYRLVANIQLLCGPCNRRKGADDIPVGI
jgi:hypothetical protein